MSLEGMQLSRYKLLHLIGSGGMGEVYLAEHTLIAQQVAIKVIRAETTPYPNTTEVARLFHREAEAVAKLDHPNILPLFDYGEERIHGTIYTYLVMPFRKEGSLTAWLLDRTNAGLRLSQEDIAHILHQAASALQHAHDHRIIHQDVKPSNFLIRNIKEDPSHPDLLLADFGIAKFASATDNASQAIRGTPTYMAPELWSGNPVFATDQYALAVMIYELLTGRPPFYGSMQQMMFKHTFDQPQPPSTLNLSISSDVNAIIMRALAKNPEDRFPTISAFSHAFQSTLLSPTIPVTYAESLPPASPKKSGGRIPFISAFAHAFQQALKGNDIRVTLAISISEALNGTTRTLILPDGQRMPIAVPAGTHDGRVIRLEGLNEPYKNSKLIVTIAISEEIAPPKPEGSSEATITAFNVGSDGSLMSYYQQSIVGTVPHLPPPVQEQETPGGWTPPYNPTFYSIVPAQSLPAEESREYQPPVNSPEKLCPYCASEIRPNDNFCLNCGNRLIPAYPPSQQAQSAMQQDATLEAPNDWGLSSPTIGTRITPSFSTIVPSDQTAVSNVDSNSTEEQVLDEAVPPSPSTIVVASDMDLDQIKQQLQAEGDSHYKAKRYRDALNVYQRIIQLDTQDARAYGNKGNALIRSGRLKEALAAYTSALEIDSNHPSIWNSKGDVLFKLKRYDGALEAYNQALRLSSEDALTWKTKGNVLTKLKLYAEALEAYEVALRFRPKDDTTWAAKGDMLTNLERYEEALAAYTRSLEIAPKKAAIWEAKGDIFSKLKHYDEALYACERAHFLKPHDGSLFHKCTMLREMAHLNKQQKKEEMPHDQIEDELKTRIVSISDLPNTLRPPVAPKRRENNQPPKQAEETMIITEGDHYDVFLSHAPEDAEAVEKLAQRLMDEACFNVWFSKWTLIPGESWQRAMAYGMSQARCCAVCLGANTPDGWFKPAIEMALYRQARDPSFRVFAVLLPGAKDIDDDYLKLYTWVNFCTSDPRYAFYLLVCGVKGVKPGRQPREDATSTLIATSTSTSISTNTLDRLRDLQQFRLDKLIDESIAVEYQRIVLEKFWLRVEDSPNE